MHCRKCPDYKPQIKILTPDAEIGEVKKGRVIDYAIEVQNVGIDELVIENVESPAKVLDTDRITV